MFKGVVASRADYGIADSDGFRRVSIKVQLETIEGNKSDMITVVDIVGKEDYKYAYFNQNDRIVLVYYVDNNGDNLIYSFEPISYRQR